jgi:hypothetical protein
MLGGFERIDRDGNVRHSVVFPKLSTVFAPLFGQHGLGETTILTMSTEQHTPVSTIERIERVLALLAYFIELEKRGHA